MSDYCKGRKYFVYRHVAPKIVQGTVNNICQGKSILAYPELSGKIVRRKIDENS